MRKSSILVAKIANDAGLPVSKAEALLVMMAETWEDSRQPNLADHGRGVSTGRWHGVIEALVKMGASRVTIDRWQEEHHKEITE